MRHRPDMTALRYRPRMAIQQPRGFTLLEAMLALVLMMCLAGLTVWSFSAALSQRGVSEAGSRIEAAVSMGRAEAQRRGEALELVAVSGQGGGRLVVRPVTQSAGQFERVSATGGMSSARPQRDTGSRRVSDQTDAEAAAESRPTRVSEIARLPDRVVVESVRSSVGGETTGTSSGSSVASASGISPASDAPPAQQEEVILAILWPTGHTTPRGQAVVRGPGGESRSILIDQWTGVCRVEALTGAEPGEDQDSESSWSAPSARTGGAGRAGSRGK